MKIINAAQIKESEAYSAAKQEIRAIDLMERAATAAAARIAEISTPDTLYCVICGCGNNGGDGMAIARLLANMNRKVQVYIVGNQKDASKEFQSNFKRLEHQMKIEISLCNDADTVKISAAKNTVIVDALLGSGFHPPLRELEMEVIKKINASGLPTVSIDLPSGLTCDEPIASGIAVHCHLCLTFQRPKLNLLLPENEKYVPEFQVLDINLDETFMEGIPSQLFYDTAKDLKFLLKKRNKFAHKGHFGHALIFGGHKGMLGCIILSAKACLRSGAGWVSVYLPGRGENMLGSHLPEAMILSDPNPDKITSCPKLENFHAIAAGMGMGSDPETVNALKLLIQNSNGGLVLDADALNILSENKTWLAFLPPLTILTPHPGEFKKLVGEFNNSHQQLEAAKYFCSKYNTILILKGAHSKVIDPSGNLFIGTTGNPALAKASSGDVLSGMIASFLAQGYAPISAARLAVFLHGYAADLFIHSNSEQGMIAGDLIDLLPVAFKKLESYPKLEYR